MDFDLRNGMAVLERTPATLRAMLSGLGPEWTDPNEAKIPPDHGPLTMWNTNTYWFDVALVSYLVLLGHLSFGRFEEHKPRWRRFLKVLIGVPLCVAPSVFLGRAALWALLGIIGVALVVVHGWWLPKNGVNGWTAEPRSRYYELIGLDPTGKARSKST